MPINPVDPAALIPVVDGIPGPWGLLAALLLLTFALHLMLMNAVVGVTLITLVSGLAAGFRSSSPDPEFRADLHAQGVLLPKGVALVVNFGIPPFLFLQGIYGQFIYSSSVLMGLWWLSVMLVVMLAYYGLYLNMAPRGISERARTWALGLSALLLLANAFLFVNNATLLQSPERWLEYTRNASGTFLNVGDPQVLPRYLHVVLACLAVGGLCLALAARFRLRRAGDGGACLSGSAAEGFSREQERRQKALANGLKWFFHATCLQFVVGSWFFMALPPAQRTLFMGGSGLATAALVFSLGLTAAALAAARRQRPVAAAVCAAGVIFSMAGMRTLLRSSLLAPYYNPAMRPFDAGPLLFFAVSLVASAVALVWLARVYLRRRASPAEQLAEARAEAVGLTDAALAAEEKDVVLVNEISLSVKDSGPEGDREKDGVTPLPDGGVGGTSAGAFIGSGGVSCAASESDDSGGVPRPGKPAGGKRP